MHRTFYTATPFLIQKHYHPFTPDISDICMNVYGMDNDHDDEP